MRQTPAFWGALAAALAGHGLILGQPWLVPPTGPGSGHSRLAVRVQAHIAGASPVAAKQQATNALPEKRNPAEIGVDLLPEPSDLDMEPPPMDAGSAQAGAEGYLQRRWLTVAPVALDRIDLPFPSVEGPVDLKLLTTLFIDDRGFVRHVRIDTPNVHGAFADAVLGTFSGLRFKPGEVMGRPVRSQLRLEVEFQAG